MEAPDLADDPSPVGVDDDVALLELLPQPAMMKAAIGRAITVVDDWM
jgi:hypothetical protein